VLAAGVTISKATLLYNWVFCGKCEAGYIPDPPVPFLGGCMYRDSYRDVYIS
jgi:hypothetical protein